MYLGTVAGPEFKNGGGQVITSIACGQPYTFDVPGYSQVWLEQSRNGAPSFTGIFPVPMPSYLADCVRDVGTYQNNVYTVQNGQKGAAIGSAVFVVTPQPATTQPATSVGLPACGSYMQACQCPPGYLPKAGITTPVSMADCMSQALPYYPNVPATSGTGDGTTGVFVPAGTTTTVASTSTTSSSPVYTAAGPPPIDLPPQQVAPPPTPGAPPPPSDFGAAVPILLGIAALFYFAGNRARG